MKEVMTAAEFREKLNSGQLIVIKGKIISTGKSEKRRSGRVSNDRLIKQAGLKQELVSWLQNKFNETIEGETKFCDIMDTKRKFRADYYVRSKKIIIEVNGGQTIFGGGRHTSGMKDKNGLTGYERDLQKSNLASSNGFKYYQFTYEQLERKEYEPIIQ